MNAYRAQGDHVAGGFACMSVIGAAIADLERKRNQEAVILHALFQVDLDLERRQGLLEALHSEGVLS